MSDSPFGHDDEFTPEFERPKVVPISSKPSKDLGELMKSFNGPIDELVKRFQEALKAEGYEGTVHLTLQVGVGGRTLMQNRHTTWDKEHESSTRTFEDGLLPGLSSFEVSQTVRRLVIYGCCAIASVGFFVGILDDMQWLGWLSLATWAAGMVFGMATHPPKKA